MVGWWDRRVGGARAAIGRIDFRAIVGEKMGSWVGSNDGSDRARSWITRIF